MTQPATGKTGVTTTLDCSGLLCPLPVYKTSIALKGLAPGEVLELITTDPGALTDIPAMARRLGDKLVSVADRRGGQVFLIEKGAAT